MHLKFFFKILKEIRTKFIFFLKHLDYYRLLREVRQLPLPKILSLKTLSKCGAFSFQWSNPFLLKKAQWDILLCIIPNPQPQPFCLSILNPLAQPFPQRKQRVRIKTTTNSAHYAEKFETHFHVVLAPVQHHYASFSSETWTYWGNESLPFFYPVIFQPSPSPWRWWAYGRHPPRILKQQEGPDFNSYILSSVTLGIFCSCKAKDVIRICHTDGA